MKGIMFQKSQKILEFEQKHQKLQEELKKVLQQFQQIEHQLAQVAQSQSKNSNKIEIFSLDKKMIQHELKAQSNQQEKLQIQIKELQAVMKINQQKSVKKQEQLYQLSKKDEQLSQRVSRLKQEYKMYLTIGQSQSNIVNLAQKLQRQKKTSERMLEILLNKQKARVKYFNVITSKRQKSEQVNHQRGQSMGKNKDPFKLPISLSPTAASFKNSKFDKKAAFFSQQNGQKRQKGQKKITETEKYNNAKKYDELIRKKNMILNKK